MFNLSGSEIVVILLLALVILGPEKLPDAVRRFGRTYAELRKMSNGFQQEFRAAIDEPMREMRETADLLARSATFDDAAPATPPADPAATATAATATAATAPTAGDEQPAGDEQAAPGPADDGPTLDLPFGPGHRAAGMPTSGGGADDDAAVEAPEEASGGDAGAAPGVPPDDAAAGEGGTGHEARHA